MNNKTKDELYDVFINVLNKQHLQDSDFFIMQGALRKMLKDVE